MTAPDTVRARLKLLNYVPKSENFKIKQKRKKRKEKDDRGPDKQANEAIVSFDSMACL